MGHRVVPRARRAEHAHVGKRQPREVAAAVGVLDVAAAAPASGEEDGVAALVAGGVRASQEGATAPAVVGREEDGRAARGQREMGGEARRWERRDARLRERSARRGGGAARRCGAGRVAAGRAAESGGLRRGVGNVTERLEG